MPRSAQLAEDRRPPRRAPRPRLPCCAAASRHGTTRRRRRGRGDGRAPARRPPSPARSRTCATAAIRRRRRRTGCGRTPASAPGRGARDLLDLGLAIDREEADAELEARAMSRSFLIVLPKEMRSGRRAGGEAMLDLDDRGRVEARAELREQLEHLRRRVRLHGVEHARVGKRPGELRVVVAHDVEVERPGRARPRVGYAGNHGCAPSWRSPHQRFNEGVPSPGLKIQAAQAARRQRVRIIPSPCDGDTERRRWVRHPTMLPWIGKGRSLIRTPGNEKQASSVLTFGGPTRPKKPVRRCFKSRPPLRAGYAGFASGCRLVIESAELSGGCPASCPDAHQPTRDHRHVRNWARGRYDHLPSTTRPFLRNSRDKSALRPQAGPAPRRESARSALESFCGRNPDVSRAEVVHGFASLARTVPLPLRSALVKEQRWTKCRHAPFTPRLPPTRNETFRCS